MATMRLARNRFELQAVVFWLAGALCGIGLMLGITALHHASSRVTLAQPPVVSLPSQVSETAGGRLGGIASDDTANDWQVRQGLQSSRAASSGILGPDIGPTPRQAAGGYDVTSQGMLVPPSFDFHLAKPQ